MLMSYLQVGVEGSELATRDGKLQRRTMSEEIVLNLRNEIQRGALKPGTRLKQGEVSAPSGVSTTPVHEAFALLQAEGFVTLDPL
jgi:DNA-binding GntR family transcriptional regulator